MSIPEIHTTRTIYLKNVLTDCCTRVIQLEMEKIGVEALSHKLGTFTFNYDSSVISQKEIENILSDLGFEVIVDREKRIVEEIKSAVVDLVHFSTFNAMIRNSDYLVERFDMTYQYMSSLFSKHENITLEKYIILHKIEKVKELLEQGEFTLSEIAYMMGYSSVQYLSTQFKNITGVSVSDYKKDPEAHRKSIDKLK